MAHPLFFGPSAWRGAHSRSTNQRHPKPKGSRFDFRACRVFLGSAWIFAIFAGVLNVGLDIGRGHWLAVLIGWCVISLSAALFVGWAVRGWMVGFIHYGLSGADGSEESVAETEAHRAVREAEARRRELAPKLAAMHPNDSRRGEVERELKRNTLVVMSGGKA